MSHLQKQNQKSQDRDWMCRSKLGCKCRIDHSIPRGKVGEGIRGDRRFIEYFFLKNEPISAKKSQMGALLPRFRSLEMFIRQRFFDVRKYGPITANEYLDHEHVPVGNGAIFYEAVKAVQQAQYFFGLRKKDSTSAFCGGSTRQGHPGGPYRGYSYAAVFWMI